MVCIYVPRNGPHRVSQSNVSREINYKTEFRSNILQSGGMNNLGKWVSARFVIGHFLSTEECLKNKKRNVM